MFTPPTSSPGFPVSRRCGIAAAYSIPWSETGRLKKVEIDVITEDGVRLANITAQVAGWGLEIDRYRFQHRQQRAVPLDHRFEDSPEMQQVLVDYQQELETTTLAGLGLTGVKHPDDSFAGSETCVDCHQSAWDVFKETPHFHATDTLVKLNPPRNVPLPSSSALPG